MALDPTKKYLKDKLAIDFKTLPMSEIEDLQNEIIKTQERFLTIQNQLIDIFEDAEQDSALIVENAEFLKQINEYLVDITTFLRKKNAN